MKKPFFSGRAAAVLLHILAWSILIVLPQYISSRYFGNNNMLTWWFFVNTATYLVIFYLNYLLLVPRYFFKNRKLIYILSLLLMLTGVYFISEVANNSFLRRQRTIRLSEVANRFQSDTITMAELIQEAGRSLSPEEERSIDSVIQAENYRRYVRSVADSAVTNNKDNDSLAQFNPPSQPRSGRPEDNTRGPRSINDSGRTFRPFVPLQIYNYVFAALFFTFFSLGLRVLERHSQTEKKQKELEREKLNSELAFLKNQVSPHFFFNTLNNIYSLITINTEDSQNAVLKLSKMMRYLLYESDQAYNALSREIEFMNNYIDLMRLRMTDKIKLEVKLPEEFEIRGVVLADQIKSLDWRGRNASFICKVPEETIQEVILKLEAIIK